MNQFLKTYIQTIYQPLKSFTWLVAHENTLRLSFVYILIPVTLYTLMYVFLTIAEGAPSSLTPWLNISKENYYSINRFLLAPSMVVCWFTATSYMHVISRFLGGTGTYEQSLATIALSISISMWPALIHDLPMSFLSATGIIDAGEHEIAMNTPTIFRTILWACYSIYFIAFLILFPLGVRIVHKLSKAKSIAIGVTSFVIFQILFLVFNR